MLKLLRILQWGFWIQFDGFNIIMWFLGCYMLDDISEFGGGINELICCFKLDGIGWDIKGVMVNLFDLVIIIVIGLIEKMVDYLE